MQSMAGISKYTLHVSDQARADIERTVDFYEFEQEGLGSEFFGNFLKTIDYALVNPEMFPCHFLFVRRALMKIFKHQILFVFDEINGVIDVLAVLYQRQNPNIITERLNYD